MRMKLVTMFRTGTAVLCFFALLTFLVLLAVLPTGCSKAEKPEGPGLHDKIEPLPEIAVKPDEELIIGDWEYRDNDYYWSLKFREDGSGTEYSSSENSERAFVADFTYEMTNGVLCLDYSILGSQTYFYSFTGSDDYDLIIETRDKSGETIETYTFKYVIPDT